MIVVKMTKTEHYQYGAAWKLHLGNIEKPELKEITVSISELDAEVLKPIFSTCKKSGRWEEHEEYI